MANARRFLQSSRRSLLTGGFLLFIAVFTLSPVAAVLIMSFDVSDIGDPFAAGLDGWRDLLSDRSNLNAFFMSVLLTIRVPIGLVIALIIGWLLVRVRVPGHRAFEFLFWFAYFLPAVPILTGWILLLDQHFGLINKLAIDIGLSSGPIFNIHSAAGIIWFHLATQTIPALVILTAPTLRMIDRAYDDAALVAGASGLTVLRRVLAPMAAPGMLIAGSAVFILALGSFDAEQILGRSAGVEVYSTKIYSALIHDPPLTTEAMAFSAVFLVIMIIIGVAYQLLVRRKAEARETFSGQAEISASSYSKRVKWFGTAGLAILTGVTILLPFGMLIAGSFMRLFGFLGIRDPWTLDNWGRVLRSSEFMDSTFATFTLGLAAAVPGTILFAAIAWAMMQLRPLARDLAALLIWLPWAFPGIILGAALLEVTLFAPGFSIFYGTIFPMILALLIKELPIGVHMIHVSMAQASKDLVSAARLTGASSLTIFRKIVLPLNTPALVVVFLLIFAAAVRNIDLIILLAPPGLETLSVLTFKFASRSEYEAATVVGTLVAILSLMTTMIAYRLANRVGWFKQ